MPPLFNLFQTKRTSAQNSSTSNIESIQILGSITEHNAHSPQELFFEDIDKWAHKKKSEQADREAAAKLIKDAYSRQAAELNLDDLNISSLPRGMENLTHLQTLSLRQTQIKDIDHLTSLPNLENIYLGDNRQIKSSPHFLKNMPSCFGLGNTRQRKSSLDTKKHVQFDKDPQRNIKIIDKTEAETPIRGKNDKNRYDGDLATVRSSGKAYSQSALRKFAKDLGKREEFAKQFTQGNANQLAEIISDFSERRESWHPEIAHQERKHIVNIAKERRRATLDIPSVNERPKR